MNKPVQAKVISDEQIVIAVKSILQYAPEGAPHSAIAALFPGIPPKVVFAKLRQAVLKGALAGCRSDVCARRGTCILGCPLGFTVPPEVTAP